MRVAIHQLHYLPWLRYIEKIARSEIFIVLDSVQFTKNDWQNRNKVKTAAGATLLTVPVIERLGQNLTEVRIQDGAPWRRKHWRTIEQAYGKAPYFKRHAPFLEATYAQPWERLNDLNRHMLEYVVGALGIGTRLVYASDLDAPGMASERLVNLVKAVGGDCYYTGAFALEQYLDTTLFEAAGIGFEVQHWHAPEYPQLHPPFVRDLAIVDLMMNCGPGSLRVLMEAQP